MNVVSLPTRRAEINEEDPGLGLQVDESQVCLGPGRLLRPWVFGFRHQVGAEVVAGKRVMAKTESGSQVGQPPVGVSRGAI